jgi:hypothetical protein
MNILKTILFFFIANIAFSQNAKLNSGKVSGRNYYTEIPYEYVNGKIIIPVSIKNKTYRFLFDTGAPNLISSQLKNSLGYNSGKSISVKDANNASNKMEVVNVPLLTIGNASFKNTATLVYDLDNNLIFDCFRVDGIIGSNMLRKSVVQILHKEKSLIITNNPKQLKLDKSYASPLNLVGDQSSPYITIQLTGGEKTANEDVLFDTGMSGFYDMHLKHYKTLKRHEIYTTLSEGKGTTSIGMFGNAKNNIQYRAKIPHLIVNGYDFKNVITSATTDNNSRIGSELIEHGNVTVDFKNKQFYFQPFENTVDLDEKLHGFSPTIKNDKVIVGIVWDKELAKKISFGDEILKVNDIDFQTMDICDLITKKSILKKSDTLEILFRNNQGETKQLILNKH